MAAHTYMKTPTAIAQFLVRKVKEFMERIERIGENIFVSAERLYEREKQTLKSLVHFFNSQTQKSLAIHREKITNVHTRIRIFPLNFVFTTKTLLESKCRELLLHSNFYIQNMRGEILRKEQIFSHIPYQRIFFSRGRKSLREKYHLVLS